MYSNRAAAGQPFVIRALTRARVYPWREQHYSRPTVLVLCPAAMAAAAINSQQTAHLCRHRWRRRRLSSSPGTRCFRLETCHDRCRRRPRSRENRWQPPPPLELRPIRKRTAAQWPRRSALRRCTAAWAIKWSAATTTDPVVDWSAGSAQRNWRMMAWLDRPTPDWSSPSVRPLDEPTPAIAPSVG